MSNQFVAIAEKPAKDKWVKARCDGVLKNDVDWVASMKRLDHADIVRLACAEYTAKEKLRLLQHSHA